MTGTGGGTSIRHEDKIYIAPSGVQKELMKPTDMFVMDFNSKEYLRRPQVQITHFHMRLVRTSDFHIQGPQTLGLHPTVYGSL